MVGCVVGQGAGEARWLRVSEEGSGTSCGQMPKARKTERITERDLEVLEFVARFGMVPREVVELWAGTKRAVTAARERRLREAGLVEVWPGVGGSGRLVLCRRSGLQAVGRVELSTPRPSPAAVHHSAVVARVAAQLERAGQRVLSEREIQARERAEAKRIYSARRGEGGYHRPDLVLLGDPDDAIEVELTAKAARRLDEILRSWRRAVAYKQFGCVRYLCSPRALPYVERALLGSMLKQAVAVEGLEPINGLLSLSPESLQRLSIREAPMVPAV
jgi:hypothetical protein